MKKIKKSNIFFFISTAFFVAWALLKTIIKGAETAIPNIDALKDNPLPLSKEIYVGMSNEVKQVFNLIALKDYLFILLIIAGVALVGYIVFKYKEDRQELKNNTEA